MATENAERTVAAIRRRFPNPRRASDRDIGRGAYCVGGAVCAWVWPYRPRTRANRFPGESEVAYALRVLGVADEDAPIWARQIIRSNDVGNFEEAWAALYAALDNQAP